MQFYLKLQLITVYNTFYGTPTQISSYGAETENMILANLGCYKLKATQGVKTTSTIEA
jgi:hypothetical protein